MDIKQIDLRIRDFGDFSDNDFGAKVQLLGLFLVMLIIRPEYQREFRYPVDKQKAVILSILKGRPLNTVYFAKNADGTFEVIDGQQRTLSILNFKAGNFSVEFNGGTLYYHNLTEDLRAKFDDYKLLAFLCEGTESEKLEWFQTINTAGEVLNLQELLNATYHGPFITSAREYFSKPTCRAVKVAQIDGKPLMKGSPIKQELLAKGLAWAGDAAGVKVENLIALHQHDANADWLWGYFAKVMEWVKAKFPFYRKEMASVEWGILYNRYKADPRLASEIEDEVKDLMRDDEVTRKTGIYEFVFSRDVRCLSLRTFTDTQKRTAYEAQGHKCAHCGREFAFDAMQGDHIKPWSKGGKTTPDNLQMLCCECNNRKGAK